LILGVPVVATVGTAVFVGEPFGPWQAVGGLMALGATATAMRHLPPSLQSESAAAASETAHIGEVAS
jgi:hypothetical protein